MNTVLSARPKLPAEADALEARFGLRLTSHLEEGTRQVPHDISERLRVARMQALGQARQAAASKRATQASATAVVAISATTGAGSAMLGRLPGGGDESAWWGRLGWVLPTLVLVAGLLGIGEWQAIEQIAQVAQLDAELLGDDLPPTAYADDGFSEFLRKPPEVVPPLSPVEGAEMAVEAVTGH